MKVGSVRCCPSPKCCLKPGESFAGAAWADRNTPTWSLLWSVLLVHGFIVFSVACYIWNQSPELGLLTVSAFEKTILRGLEETLVTQLGASFAVPVLLWFVVTFRLRDLTTIGKDVAGIISNGRGAG